LLELEDGGLKAAGSPGKKADGIVSVNPEID
jgi:hypothetical protein